MDTEKLLALLGESLETLAAIEHQRWSHWQRHMHALGKPLPDGGLELPADLVQQWARQIATPYSELSEPEKESDREQVRRYLPAIASALGEDEPPT